MRTLTRKLAIIEPQMLLVGIDLAAEKNVAIVINQQARVVGRIRFAHQRQEYTMLGERLEQLRQRHQATGVLVGMEPTNYYWKLVAAELERQGIRYRLVNAYTVKKHREGDQLDRAKDDDRDGFVIADLLRTGKFTETQLLPGAYAELRQYSSLYRQQNEAITRQKILLRQAVGQTFPELGQVFHDLTGQTAQALLQHHAAAHVIRQLSEAAFLAAVRTDFQGRRFQVKKLQQAYQLAQHSVGLQATQGLELAIQGHLRLLAVQEAYLNQVKEQLVQTFHQLPQAPYLLTLALGEVTTALILAEIGDPSHYTNARQLVKLAGLQPTPDSSGQKTHSPTPMSGKGRGQLRTTLYFACLRLIQQDEAFAARYQHLQQRPTNPLKGMQALVVLMTKLLRIFWALLTQKTAYNPMMEHTQTA